MIGAIERIEAGRRLFLPRRGSVCQEHAPLRPSRSGEIRIGSNGNLHTHIGCGQSGQLEGPVENQFHIHVCTRAFKRLMDKRRAP